MIDAGYDPQGMAEVMEILAAASGGARQPEFLSTHPNPDNRIEQIEARIQNADSEC
jgi:predicted Zn-dependent protease